MLRQGPIPAFVHGVYEYVGGALLIALPLILNYHTGAATAVSIVLGVLVIAMAATSSGQAGLIREIPVVAHLLLDIVVAAVLIASPFLFGFNKETKPTVVFIVAGVLHLLVTIATRFRKDERPRRRRGEPLPAASGAPAQAGAGADEPPRRTRP